MAVGKHQANAERSLHAANLPAVARLRKIDAIWRSSRSRAATKWQPGRKGHQRGRRERPSCPDRSPSRSEPEGNKAAEHQGGKLWLLNSKPLLQSASLRERSA